MLTESPEDYVAVGGQSLQFNTGDTEICHTITINHDNMCEEPYEDFFSHLTLLSGVEPINVTRTPASVIINDTTEPECSESDNILEMCCKLWMIFHSCFR